MLTRLPLAEDMLAFVSVISLYRLEKVTLSKPT